MKPATYKDVERVAVVAIRVNGGTQMRAGLNAETVSEYAAAMLEYGGWGKFEPVEVYHDGATYWLADGFHRVAAAKEAGIELAAAKVHAGDQRKAILHAAGANADHGLRRTNADKRRAVEVLVRDPVWQTWSDSAIAKACKVDPKTVANVRQLLVSTMEIHSESERQTTDGRVMNTENIGRKSEAEAAPPAAPEPDYVTVDELGRLVQEFVVAKLSKDANTQIYYLNAMAEGKDDAALDRLVGHLKRVAHLDHYRDEDLTQALKNVATAKQQAAQDRAAKRGPEPPSEWKLRDAIESWLKGKELTATQQHALLVALQEKEEDSKSPFRDVEHQQFIAALPKHWRKRELKAALT